MNHVVASAGTVEQHGAFREARIDVVFRKVSHGEKRSRGSFGAERLRGFGASDSELFILSSTGRATHSDTANDLPVDNNGNSALQRRKKGIGQRCHCRAAFVDDVFKYFG